MHRSFSGASEYWNPKVQEDIYIKSQIGRYRIRGYGGARPLPHLADLAFRRDVSRAGKDADVVSKVALRTEIGGFNGANPLELSMPVMIAPMSYGALSASTKRAVGLASTLSGIAENTGEGGMSDAQRGAASQLIFQMLGGRLGWNIHDMNRADGLEIYISQGAKPGLGGQLMAKKVTPELARIRGIPSGIDLRSPSRHPDILGGDDLLIQDVDRLMQRCPGLEVHLDTALGRDVSLGELKERHDAVLLTIGAWWGKPMGIPGEEDERVVDGVGFLRRVNAGERPEMPETVVVVGGGDVAMDACRVAKRLPGCRYVNVIYRRGPGEIPARKIQLHHAIKEDVEFLYHTQQVAVIPRGNQLALECVKTALGEPDDDGRRRPVAIEGSEHEILCGSVIAAVGQRSICEELHRADMMAPDRVRTEWDSMRTSDPMVFAAGDGAFGGSTIVMAMQHGQRAAYYLRHYLEGNRDPLPYRTPYRTRRVPVAQDLMWEKFPIQEPVFCGLGERPAEFPQIELTYDTNTARAEAARCYRCDAETGSADYSVQHREDIFSMARTDPQDAPKLEAMLDRRLRLRENPFPQERPACLDDLVFLPANLSRLVIDPYREACKIGWRLGERLELDIPFFVAGFDAASEELKAPIDRGVVAAGAAYLGATRPGPNAPWLQLCEPGRDAPSHDAAGVVYRVGER